MLRTVSITRQLSEIGELSVAIWRIFELLVGGLTVFLVLWGDENGCDLGRTAGAMAGCEVESCRGFGGPHSKTP